MDTSKLDLETIWGKAKTGHVTVVPYVLFVGDGATYIDDATIPNEGAVLMLAMDDGVPLWWQHFPQARPGDTLEIKDPITVHIGSL